MLICKEYMHNYVRRMFTSLFPNPIPMFLSIFFSVFTLFVVIAEMFDHVGLYVSTKFITVQRVVQCIETALNDQSHAKPERAFLKLN